MSAAGGDAVISPPRSRPRRSTGSRSRLPWRCSPRPRSACSAPSSSPRAGAASSRPSSPAPASSRPASSPRVVFDRSPQQTLLIAESMSRDRLAALTQVLVAGFGLASRARLLGRPAPRPRRRVLRAARRRRWRDGVLRLRREPDDAVPRARVVLDLALHPRRARHAPEGVARGRAQVPDRRQLRLGDPAVRLGADLRRHRRARLQRDPRPRRARTTRCSSRAWR